MSVLASRLSAQRVSAPAKSISEVAQHVLALQGQDLAQVEWALALRCVGATLQTVESAFSACDVVRTWPMRGTLHVVAGADVKWLTAMSAERNISRTAKRHRDLEITERDVSAARTIVERALSGKKRMLREEVFEHLVRGKQRVDQQRGVHLLWFLAQHGVICLAGEHFVLIDEWLPRARKLQGDEALGELAAGYFRGHGVATVEDFAWWSGLSKGEAKRGMEIAGPRKPTALPEVPAALVLPGFDEYFIGYTDRSACLDPKYFERIVPGGNGVFQPMIALDGHIRGTWRRKVEKKRVTLTMTAFTKFSTAERREIESAAASYGVFHDKPLVVQF